MTNGNKSFLVKANEFEFTFTEDEIASIDLIKNSDTEFNLLKGHRSVNAKLIEPNNNGKALRIEVEGEQFEVEIREELDLMLEKMGFNNVSTAHTKEIKAPMPGLVLEIAVTAGQEVKEGDKILILEAMKMENSIVAHSNARVKKINVKAGQPVDKGQVLVELE